MTNNQGILIIILSCFAIAGLRCQTNSGMITPFSIEGETGSGFVGDIAVSDDSGLVNSMSIIVDQNSIVNIQKVFSNHRFQIYPNPSKKLIQIDSEQDFEIIEISTIQGQVIHRTQDIQIDVSWMVDGTYLLTIDNLETLIFIKE